MRVALYTRVSTEKQDYENQLYQLKEYCKNNNWQIYKIYAEIISGKSADRPEFKKMMLEASQKKFDIVLVWALDRFTREGVDKVWRYITELDHYGITFRSFKEPFLNSDNKMQRDILFSLMGVLAEQERLRISERTKAGIEKARRAGKIIGKPPIRDKIKKEIIELREQGKSYREICQEVYYWDSSRNKHNVSMGLVHKILSGGYTK